VTARWRAISWAALAVAAVISIARGLAMGLTRAGDLQWSPAVVFLSGRNPYELWLAGNPGHEILFKQVPNYLHVLYVTLVPLAALDFASARVVWAFGGIALAVGMALALARHYRLDRTRTALLLGLFLCGSPFRVGLQLGQTTPFVMAFLILPFLAVRGGNVLQGLGFAKYSFAPPFLIYALLRRGPAAALAGLVVPLAGFVVFCLWTGTSPLEAALQPLAVASRNLGVTVGDAMAVTEQVFGRVTVLSGGVALALCCVLVHGAVRHPDEDLHLPLVALISLATFKHHIYDYAMLLPVLAYSLKPGATVHRVPIWLATAWFWFGRHGVEKMLALSGLNVQVGRTVLVIPCFLVLTTLIVHLLRTDAAGRRVRWWGWGQVRQKAVAGSSAARRSAAEP